MRQALRTLRYARYVTHARYWTAPGFKSVSLVHYARLTGEQTHAVRMIQDHTFPFVEEDPAFRQGNTNIRRQKRREDVGVTQE